MAQNGEANRYLYEQIYSELKEEILSGAYRKGDWFPPERVLKDRFATTHLTVRNALAKLVLEGYIERYSGKGTIVIYSRERPPAPRKTALRFPWAHLVLEDLSEPNAALAEALESNLRKVPMPLRISCHRGDALLSRSLCQEALQSGALLLLQPAGAIDSTPNRPTPPRFTIDIHVSGMDSPGPRVSVDEVEAGRKAARYLLDRGHHVIAFITPGPQPALRSGFLEGAASHGLTADQSVICSCAGGAEGGESATRELLAHLPDARGLFCASDETAAGALNGLRGAGLEPGRDCSVVGFGNTRLARSFRLTSIDPGLQRQAERVAATVLEGISEGALLPRAFLIAPELYIRAT